MENRDETGAPQQDVTNCENGKASVRFRETDAVPQLPSPSDNGPQEKMAIKTAGKPIARWSWWQIILGKRDAEQGSKGRGWRTAPFVFLGEFGERTASFGFQLNIVNYFVYDMNFSLASAATGATNFVGASSIAPLAGAFIADAFLGRFLTFSLGCLFYLAGLTVFTIDATSKDLRPDSCTVRQRGMGTCEKANSRQLWVLWISLVLQCVGSGGVKPCSLPFGADQFDRSNKKHESQLRHYFNWYYMIVALAMLTASTLIIYVQDSIDFGWAGIISVIIMAVGTVIFVAGAPFYVYLPPSGSPMTKMVQVVVAAVRKWKYTLPENPDDLYQGRNFEERESAAVQKELLGHTDNFRFLDKAAILEAQPDGTKIYHPWRLSTMQDVEELKIVLRIVPVWLTTIIVSLVTVQTGTFVSQQALSMDRHIGKILLPPASMIVFAIAALLIGIPIYDLLFIKFLRKFTGNPKGISYLQRIGIGVFINIFTMVCSALVEKKRRNLAYSTGKAEMPLGSSVLPISAMWLIPQNVLAGITELFVVIGLLEFFYNEAPESIRSMSNALFWLSMGLGSFLSSLIVTIIQSVTGNDCNKPLPSPSLPTQCGWIQSTMKLGHLDYFYWFLAVLAFINFVCYLGISHWYVYKKTNVDDGSTREISMMAH